MVTPTEVDGLEALIYRLLADAVLLVHAGFVAFIVLGLALILLGLWRGWCWVRNSWFRMIHLASILLVAGQALLGVICPLTLLENYLRMRAGQTVYPGSYVMYWVHELLFMEADSWVFTLAYCLFALLVVLAFVVGSPVFRSTGGVR